MKRLMSVPLVLAALTIAAAGASQTVPATQTGRGAAPPPPSPQEILLWENGAPGALGQTDADKPSITVYRAPRGSSGTAIVVAPGGGYANLATEHEGRQEAYWFNAMGITAFVLRYDSGLDTTIRSSWATRSAPFVRSAHAQRNSTSFPIASA